MPRTFNLSRLKQHSITLIEAASARIDQAAAAQMDYLLLRWMCAMTAVELHGIWERYAESRLVAALNHSAGHFLTSHDITGVKRVSVGFASYAVRTGGRFFDFRSVEELIGKGTELLGREHNPFLKLSSRQRSYLNALSCIRNRVVHGSDASIAAYRRELRSAYGIKAAPSPGEFLSSIDYSCKSPAIRRPRLYGLTGIITDAIRET